MGFNPLNHPLKIRKSIGTPTPKMGVHLGMRGSLTVFCTPRSMRYDSQASFLARNLTSPCFGREPKARVAAGGTTKRNYSYC